MFRTSVHYLLYCFRTRQLRKTWFELSRLKFCRNDLKGNKNKSELVGGFELSRVRVTEGKISVNVGMKSTGNQLWLELS